MESWRHVWRKAIHNLVTVEQLESLRTALVKDDPRLLQGATTTPPPLRCVLTWPVEAACGLGYCGWCPQGDECELETVAEVEEFFARMCFEIDNLIGEPAACRWFLLWFDCTPRDEMRRELLVEVNRSLALKLSEMGDVEIAAAFLATEHQ